MEALVQPILDVLNFIGWLFLNIKNLVEYLIQPIKFVITFLAEFFGAFSTLATPDNLWTQDYAGLQFVSQLPYWNVLSGIFFGLIIFLGVFTLIKIIKV